MFSLLRGSATSDRRKSAKLISSVAANLATAIKPLAKGNGASYGNTTKNFLIELSSSSTDARLNRRSKRERIVSYSQINQQVRNIHKSGGKIIIKGLFIGFKNVHQIWYKSCHFHTNIVE